MGWNVSAPRTRLEWGIFVGLLLAFYAVVMFLTSGLQIGVLHGQENETDY